jgi:hypothetical protein
LEKIIEILAWPVTTIIIVLLLRKPLVELVSVLKKLKIKDIELEFEREAKNILAEAERDLPEPEKAPEKPSSSSTNLMYRLSPPEPVKQILGAWRELEILLKSTIQKNNLPECKTVREMVNTLEGNKIISSETAKTILDLAAFRNRVAHSEKEVISNEASSDFMKATDRVTLLILL